MHRRVISVTRYKDSNKEVWNRFLTESNMDSILFRREFMDYHRDQFIDNSLLVLNNDNVVALFPANIANNEIHSHGGLTFGGLIVKQGEYAKKSLTYLTEVLKHLHDQKIGKIFLKLSPSFYHVNSQDEIEYAMFVAEAKLYRTDVAFAIDNSLTPAIKYQERRRRSIKKAIKSQVSIKESTDFNEFWDEILTPNLESRFGVAPVHSLDQIRKLSSENPNKIRQFNAYLNNKIVAGTTIFESNNVAHAQYISASNEGRNSGAIDFLFDQLISETYSAKRFFDFGIANENQGKNINHGLMDWKEGFGARAFAHRFYDINPANYTILEELLK